MGTMTLKERFDYHMGEAGKHEAWAIQSGHSEYNIQRAQLHATLAMAIAQRMTAVETAELVRLAMEAPTDLR